MVKTYIRYIIVGLVVPALYIATGLFGLILFAVPPGYATLVFLPSGIAISSVCLFDLAAIPGVFFGSFLLNVIIGAQFIEQVAILNALLIAAASAIQAAVGGYLFRYNIQFRNLTLTNITNLMCLTMLTPWVCMISATLSTCGLWLLGTVSTTQALNTWVHWYFGDSIGVLIILPWMLFFAQPLTESLRRQTISRWTKDVLDGKVH